MQNPYRLHLRRRWRTSIWKMDLVSAELRPETPRWYFFLRSVSASEFCGEIKASDTSKVSWRLSVNFRHCLSWDSWEDDAESRHAIVPGRPHARLAGDDARQLGFPLQSVAGGAAPLKHSVAHSRLFWVASYGWGYTVVKRITAIV